MKNKIQFCLIALIPALLIFTSVYAKEQIVDFEDKSLPVLNDVLTNITDDITDAETDISTNTTNIATNTTNISTNATELDGFEDGSNVIVIENRTSDPGSPVEGRIWLRTDL